MSQKPNLPLGDIAGYDQGKLKKTEVADKSGVSEHDKLLATVASGQVNLKHTETTEKTWNPTKEDLEADAKHEN
jgi:hypothetical protein